MDMCWNMDEGHCDQKKWTSVVAIEKETPSEPLKVSDSIEAQDASSDVLASQISALHAHLAAISRTYMITLFESPLSLQEIRANPKKATQHYNRIIDLVKMVYDRVRIQRQTPELLEEFTDKSTAHLASLPLPIELTLDLFSRLIRTTPDCMTVDIPAHLDNLLLGLSLRLWSQGVPFYKFPSGLLNRLPSPQEVAEEKGNWHVSAERSRLKRSLQFVYEGLRVSVIKVMVCKAIGDRLPTELIDIVLHFLLGPLELPRSKEYTKIWQPLSNDSFNGSLYWDSIERKFNAKVSSSRRNRYTTPTLSPWDTRFPEGVAPIRYARARYR